MKSHLLSLLAILAAVLLYSNTVSAESTTDKISIEDFWVVKGEKVAVGLQVTNASRYTAFQCDLFLPEGLTLVRDEQGEPMLSLCGANEQSHIIESNTLADGSIRIVVMSMSNVAFTPEDAIANFTIAVSSNVIGKQTIRIENARLVSVGDRKESNVSNTQTTANVVEQKTTITAKNSTRKYGDENPVFEYTIEGPALDGEPEVVSEANATSPVGNYDIVVKQGTIKNTCLIFVNATLTITKAPLTVKVEDVTREQYVENPEFMITYAGWKLDEDESVLTKKPTATTMATKESPVGEYEIVVSGGEARNYDLKYQNGVLTVIESTGISEVSVNLPADVYTLQGYRVLTKATTLEGLPKGVYIVNGKKVVIK